LKKVLKLIDEKYNETISRAEIENTSHYSYRNTQRLFKQNYKETISNFQKRLKLENAYKKLLFTSDSISNIAFEVGYENQSSFCKAFKKQFNLSPLAARKQKRVIFNTPLNTEIQCHSTIDYRIEYKTPMNVFYTTLLTHNYDNKAINDLWDNSSISLNNGKDLQCFGLIIDEPLISKNTHCRYEVCMSEKPNSDEYLSKIIFGRKYIVFKHSGGYDSIENTYNKIYHALVNDLNYELDNSPIIEHYIVNDLHTSNQEEFITEILLALK